MSEELENSANAVLLTVGVATHILPSIIVDLDIYATFLFHLLSAVSVFMIVVINKKKFINEIKTILKWKKR